MLKTEDEKVIECAERILKSKKIVLLSGAGMSTSAGIPDFRGDKGLYKRKDYNNPEQIFDIDYFHRDPSIFFDFHKEFLKKLKKIKPTFTHRFFFELENMGKLKGIITQNIDSLHQNAGNKLVYEIHGGIWNNYCVSCGKKYDLDNFYKKLQNGIPKCDKCNGIIKPDIVFYGEMVKCIEKSEQLVSEADLLFVLGSSLNVIPAALLPALTKGDIVVINKGNISMQYLPQDKLKIFSNSDIDTFFKKVNDIIKIV